jgi:DNA repair exonuclease SbcCD ATPase subunit
MFTQRIKDLSLSNFGPFVGSHSISLPTNGLLLIKGASGSGKSYLLNSIPYVLGGCPFASTELQSWFTDDPPEVKLSLETQKGLIDVIRKKGLTLKGNQLKEVYKGKAADPELDALFGMDSKVRAQVTYRGQKKPGLFLSMSDSDKKSFLTKLLDLGKYEKVEKAAKDAIDSLEKDLLGKQASLDTYQALFDIAKDNCSNISYDKTTLSNLLSNKRLIEDDILTKQSSQIEINSSIEAIRKQHQEGLDVDYRKFDAEIMEISNRDKPAEIIKIKEDIKKQQERLEKCRKYDSDKRLETANKIAAINEEIKDIVVKYNNLGSAYRNNCRSELDKQKFLLTQDLNTSTAQLKEQENKLKATLKTRQDVKNELVSVANDIEDLKQQNCPTCKQTWQESLRILNEKLQRQKDLLQFIADTADVDTSLIKIQEEINKGQVEYKTSLDKITEGLTEECSINVSRAEVEKTAAIAVKQQELNETKVPEPHPAGIQVLAKIKELEANIESAELQYKNLKEADISILNRKKQEFKKTADLRLVEKVTGKQLQLDEINKKLENLRNQFNTINNQIAEQKTLESLSNERQKALEKAAIDLEQAKATKGQTEAKLALESDLVALVGYKGFLGAIFGDILAEIAAQTNDIIGQVANVKHLTIDFETEKEAVATGNVTSRITPVVYNRGRRVSFDAGISGGQQTSVELAIDLAVSNVVSSRRGVYPNFLILDESLHGLGGVDKESCIEMLQSVAGERLVLVVDHSPEFCNLFSQVIEVIQEDGQSRIL